MDVSLESKSLPSVGNSRKSYLQVTSQRLAKGKLVHLHGRRSLALPSVGPGSQLPTCRIYRATSRGNPQHQTKGCEIISQQKGDFATLCKIICFMAILFASSPCIPDLLMEKDFKAFVLHVSKLPIALPKIPHNSPQSRIALKIVVDHLASLLVYDGRLTNDDFLNEDIVACFVDIPHGDHILRSVRLAFSNRHPCQNNIVEYEACILGLETTLKLRIR
ncbi:hypothetical protein AAG906_003706 [Vitis piasezkii]